MNKTSILAGKVIDRNQGIAEQSFAWALQIDQELEDLWKKLDPQYLAYEDMLADVEHNAAELREKIMLQMIYHQIRVYLHLPFMLKSQSNSRFTYSRTACLNGSREVLRLYQALRTGEVQPLYECKAIDFIGFTAAVLIVLGLFNYGVTMTPIAPKDKEADIRLIEISIDIFRRASSEKGGKVALQSAEVLEKMLNKYKMETTGQPGGGCGPDDCGGMMEFVIPYFGTISIRKGGKQVTHEDMARNAHCTAVQHGSAKMSPAALSTISRSSIAQLTPNSETASTADLFKTASTASNPGLQTPSTNPTSTTSPDQAFNFQDPFVSYEGFYNWGNALDTPATGTASGTQINDDSLNNYPLPTNNFSWQNMPMDIDQDWSWFLNDGGNTSGVGAGASGNQPPVNDQFAQSGFVGFG